MKWSKYIKAFFSSGEASHKSQYNHFNDEEDCVSYYIPPTNNEDFAFQEISQSERKREIEQELSDRPQETLNDETSIDIPDLFVLRGEGNIVMEAGKLNNNEKVEKSAEEISLSTPHIEVIGIAVGNLIKEFDSYFERTVSDDAKQLIEIMQYRLIETASTWGISPIDNDTIFDVLRHVPVPFSIVPDGTPIKGIKRTGLTLGDKVLLKAQIVI